MKTLIVSLLAQALSFSFVLSQGNFNHVNSKNLQTPISIDDSTFVMWDTSRQMIVVARYLFTHYEFHPVTHPDRPDKIVYGVERVGQSLSGATLFNEGAPVYVTPDSLVVGNRSLGSFRDIKNFYRKLVSNLGAVTQERDMEKLCRLVRQKEKASDDGTFLLAVDKTEALPGCQIQYDGYQAEVFVFHGNETKRFSFFPLEFYITGRHPELLRQAIEILQRGGFVGGYQ